ncbi:hypothetical protein CG723_41485 [Streptomyces sp. CB01635]|nr:hypothetical protein CG723_41485 [Streptomyces sp. CB01635]
MLCASTAQDARDAASRRDPLTELLRRDAYTTQARQVLRRHGDDTAVVLVSGVRAGSFKAV